MFKSFDGTVYWQVGDMVLTRYFGNDEGRYGTMVAAEVTEMDEKASLGRHDETSLCKVVIEDSVRYQDENGEMRTDVSTYLWSSQLFPVEEEEEDPLRVVYLLWITKHVTGQGERDILYAVYGDKELALRNLSMLEDSYFYPRAFITPTTVLFT